MTVQEEGILNVPKNSIRVVLVRYDNGNSEVSAVLSHVPTKQTFLSHTLCLCLPKFGRSYHGFCGGPAPSQGKDAIMVVVVRLTKYAHFVSLIDPFSAPIANDIFTREIIRLHGTPPKDCM